MNEELIERLAQKIAPYVAEHIRKNEIEPRLGTRPKIGKIVSVNGSPKANHEYECWVEPISSDGTRDTSPPFPLDNYVTRIVTGTMVAYGYDEIAGREVVLGHAYTNPGFMENGESLNNVVRHGKDHERVRTSSGRKLIKNRYDPILVDTPNIYPFRVRPSVNGGAAIDIIGGMYIRDNVEVELGDVTGYSLSSHLPGTANTQRYLSVWLNLSDNTLNYTEGSTVGAGEPRPPAPSVTNADALRIANVRCYNGQTTVSETEDIYPTINIVGANSDTPANVPYQVTTDPGQLTTNDSVDKDTKVQLRGGLSVGGNSDGDTTNAVFDVTNSDATAYAEDVPANSASLVVLANDADHVSGGVIAGTVYRLNGDSQTRKNFIGSITDATGTRVAHLVFVTDDGTNREERMRIQGDGNIGIDNASPLKLLHVGPGSDATTQSYEGVYIAIDGIAQLAVRNNTDDVEGGIFAHSNGNVYMGSWTNDGLRLRTNNTDRAVIDASGNFGVGTTGPLGPFHIQSGVYNNLSWVSDSVDGTSDVIIPNGTGDVAHLLQATWQVYDQSSVVQGSSGQVTPGNTLDIFTNASDIVTLTVAANGEASIARSGGSLTYTVILNLFWQGT